MMSGFTFDDVLTEIERLDSEMPEGWSVSEMSDETGRSVNWCRAMVRKLITAKKVVYGGRKRAETIDGRSCYVPVYRRVEA